MCKVNVSPCRIFSDDNHYYSLSAKIFFSITEGHKAWKLHFSNSITRRVWLDFSNEWALHKIWKAKEKKSLAAAGWNTGNNRCGVCKTLLSFLRKIIFFNISGIWNHQLFSVVLDENWFNSSTWELFISVLQETKTTAGSFVEGSLCIHFSLKQPS